MVVHVGRLDTGKIAGAICSSSAGFGTALTAEAAELGEPVES